MTDFYVGGTGSYVGEAMVGSPSDIIDPVVPKERSTRVAIPQDPSNVREACGYGIVFVSLALMQPGGVRISAPEYRTGTHQWAMAEAQPHGWIHVTHPSLIPAPAASPLIGKTAVAAQEHTFDGRGTLWKGAPYLDRRIGSFLTAAPQQEFQGYGTLWKGAPYLQTGIGKTRIAAQEHPYDGAAQLWGPQPAGIDVGQPKTLIAAQEHAYDGSGVTFGKVTPAPIVTVDAPIGVFRFSGPQQDAQGYAALWRGAPYLDTRIGTFIVSAQEHWYRHSAQLWKGAPYLDVPVGKTGIAAQRHVFDGKGTLWRGAPYLDTAIGKTLLAAGEHADSAFAKLYGTAPPTVIGVDAPIGITRFATNEYSYEPVQYGYVIPQNADAIPPPAVVIATDQPTGGMRHKRRRYFVEVDNQLFQVDSPAEAAELLAKAREIAIGPAKAAASMAVRRALRKGTVPKSPKIPSIASDAPELHDIVIRARAELAELYRSELQNAEIRYRLVKQRQEDDNDDDDILLLM